MKHPRPDGLTLAVCAAGVLLNVVLACNLFLPKAWTGRNDFMGFYAGARLAGSAHLYDRASVRQLHLEATGETGEIQYGRLPIYALALKPLGWMRFETAYVAWEIVLAAAFAGFIVLWPAADSLTKWFVCCWSLPAFVSLFNGQDDVVLLLLVALAVRLQRSEKPWAAGVVLALCGASKFHLFTLVPLVLAAQRRWRMFAGAALCACGLLAASFGVAGAGWPSDLYATLTDPRVSTGLEHMPNLHSLLSGMRFSIPLQIGLSALLAAGVYMAARRSDSFEAPLGLAMGAGVLVGYHAYVHDGVLLIPALIAFSGAAAYVRIPAMTLVTPIPWCLLHLTAKPFAALSQSLVLIFVLGEILFLWQAKHTLPRPAWSPVSRADTARAWAQAEANSIGPTATSARRAGSL